ncbi:hypothetical protein FJV41_44460 [Myxococcus llanfairpwllgwyngyllgogerychwyrndrobwllllantysiliogogogochensis]|uniref:Uncharacterized protein n=1 Tax=Myxococcus llanfairpwllgwyngyllgogerychwyrndrobwllllantysiliogogogochensis TaxID=2590453 RepID=A0A540WKE1_9BACT|nr:hypothetical protein [Myxococcus llanfairpwllgwyngyllgogerychwyrndrobwllllantysiliogogogochensis]TQF09468.1 hypothetical protein FJV41_44460 [Myxococcus llanfairpwllgwyngyllgogerychwyrndrobwllllantysiliogogogochensis]
MKNDQLRLNLSITTAVTVLSLKTELLFDGKHIDPTTSPIDQFTERIAELNKLVPQPGGFSATQAQLVLLGVIGAVESYMRAIVRVSIYLDQTALNCARSLNVSFGAALHLSKELLPEALLERTSFIGKKAIVETLRDLLGVRGNLPLGVEQSLENYIRVCHLRHCAVHRFGRLGSGNAIELGFDDHRELLEKPLVLTYASLQEAILICETFVRVMNNFLFSELLGRVQFTSWTWDFRRDRRHFFKYYVSFADHASSRPSLSAFAMYRELRQQLKDHLGSKKKR